MDRNSKQQIRQSAAQAIRTIIQAAKELTIAEQLLLDNNCLENKPTDRLNNQISAKRQIKTEAPADG